MNTSHTFVRPAADEHSLYYGSYIQLVPDGDILQTLHTQHAEINKLLCDMADDQAMASPAPGEWSVKQVVVHLSDTERLFAFRALWFARGEMSALPGMEPDPWMANQDANARPLADLLAEYAHLRAASVAFFANLDGAAWQRRGTASGTAISVRALAWLLAGHERHHINALREQIAAGVPS